jgi:hypothetical protein
VPFFPIDNVETKIGGVVLIEYKNYLEKNNSVIDSENDVIDPDIIVSKRKRLLAEAKSEIRKHLQQQLDVALKDFYSNDLPKNNLRVS